MKQRFDFDEFRINEVTSSISEIIIRIYFLDQDTKQVYI